MALKKINGYVVNLTSIPEDILDTTSLYELGQDSYSKLEITLKSERHKYSDDFTLEDYLLEEYPEIKEGDTIYIYNNNN